MYVLIITLISTIGIQSPVVLHGEPPLSYESYGECQQDGEKIQDWLTQDHMKATYECKEVHDEKKG